MLGAIAKVCFGQWEAQQYKGWLIIKDLICKARCYLKAKLSEALIHWLCIIHSAISFLKTPGILYDMRRYWSLMLAGLIGCWIIVVVIGVIFFCILIRGVKFSRLFDSCSLVLMSSLDVCWGGSAEFIICLALSLLVEVSSMLLGGRICAEGFMRSSHRRIRLPMLLPSSKSLSWTFLWTLTAISKTLRVRLCNGKIQ